MGIGAGMYGLSGSGMDVDDMVKKMMTAQQTTYDKMYKNKVSQQWKKTELSSFYKTLLQFRSDTTDFRLQSNMAARFGKSSDENVVTVTANGEAVEMTHEVTIEQLAGSAFLQSAKGITRDSAATDPKSIKLEDMIGPQGTALDTDVAISFVVHDGTTKNDDGTDKLRVVSYTYGQIKEDRTNPEAPREALTMNDLASDINDLGLNVQASFDATNDSFGLSNRQSGTKNTVSIAIYGGGLKDVDKVTDIPAPPQQGMDNTAQLFNNMHMAAYTTGSNGMGTELKLDSSDLTKKIEVHGQSAKAKIDGKEYTSDSNQITTGGVVYTLRKKSDSKDVGGVPTLDPTRISITSDTEKVIDNVKKFIDTYNKMLDSINNKLYEESYKEYKPLTDDEKKAMSEDEIKRWEEKAKSGLLANDKVLKDIVSDMRSAIMQPIEGIAGKYNSAAALGITVTTNKDHGKLELSDAGEKKLRTALAEDANIVWKVFGKEAEQTGDNVNDETKDSITYDTQGFVSRLSKIATTGMNNINANAGSTGEDDQSLIGVKIAGITTQMKAFTKKMDAYQARLYKQFNAMEVAISQLNSQASFVSQYGGGA